jgi:3-phenylpropionate/cinnamic acid dioxygenase small subunit
MSAGRSVEERLQRLEDLEEIRDLVKDYARHLDARDFASYSALFAREGEWTGASGSARTPAGIKGMLEERITPRAEAPGETHFHLIADPAIELDGDSARARTTWALIVRGPDDTPVVRFYGHYRDELVREDGRWRFALRETFTDVPDKPPVPRSA